MHAIVALLHAAVPPVVAQQTSPASPHSAHIPAMPMPALRPVQAKPPEQVPTLPWPQQSSPEPPQVPHWLPPVATRHDIVPLQAACIPPSAPAPCGQQGCPVPPQAAHIPGTPLPLLRPPHASPGEQVPALPVPQHGCPGPPQVPHLSSPGDETQLMPVWHALGPPQQICPLAPHALQLPAPPSARPPQARPDWQLLPGQHAWPAPPQVSQVAGVLLPGGLLHPSPLLQVLLAQQGCPVPPHALQTLPPPVTARQSRVD
jgi:hypothetical protein